MQLRDLALDTKAQDDFLDSFAGVGDPEPLRDALELFAKGATPEQIGKRVYDHLQNTFTSMIEAGRMA